MSVQRLSSKRWRAQIHVTGKGNVGVGKLLGLPTSTFATKREAVAARHEARKKLGKIRGEVTVDQFRTRWLSDQLFARPKQSTMIVNEERTKAFAQKYGSLGLEQITDQIVGEWLAGGKRNSTVPALRAMFNDAMSAKAGRLAGRNPFARLGIRKSKGNARVDPPGEETVWALIAAARRLTCPSFAAWLQVAAFTGMRPGELDALRWDRVDFEAGRIQVVEQFNAASKTFTSPKTEASKRPAVITPPAREALLATPREPGGFCFVSLRGTHWTASSRAYHWKAVRASVGYEKSLYLATRHFAGWYMYNVLLLPAEDIAIALGHDDGGHLVRTLYGHRSREDALRRVANAYEARNVRPLDSFRREETG